MMKKKARLIAFYLPQYHPIPENNGWWGHGFTEWTNVVKARPLFAGHEQPHLPADLGFYDLRVPETRAEQARLAAEHGIEAFCYYHYWFGHGKQLLERPFQEVVRLGEPDFPFCLCWANQTWSGIWHGAPNRVLIEQKYPGVQDYTDHFYSLLSAFRDQRYLKVNGRLLFVIYQPDVFEDILNFTRCWQELAAREGLEGFHFVAHFTTENPGQYGCSGCMDGASFVRMPPRSLFDAAGRALQGVLNLVPFLRRPAVRHYKDYVNYMHEQSIGPEEYPVVIPNWDNTPRSGKRGWVLKGSRPAHFKRMLDSVISRLGYREDPENRIVFIKAWNEWAEGNYLEPDQKHGFAYLHAVRECVTDQGNGGEK